jgi:hypothetical protein
MKKLKEIKQGRRETKPKKEKAMKQQKIKKQHNSLTSIEE